MPGSPKVIPTDSTPPLRIGTAAWALPASVREEFPPGASLLARYAQKLNAVEINSSFYREHKPDTYRRWAESVPEDFRFAVKLSRYFTQETQLKLDRESRARLHEILRGIASLGDKLEVLLVQLPPRLGFEAQVAETFLQALRGEYAGEIAWEPRHMTWTSREALALLAEHRVAKVAADPERCPLPEDAQSAAEPFTYLRLHGSPEIYKSKYSPEVIAQTASRMQRAQDAKKSAWCIFDNTTFGYATEDALALLTATASASASRTGGRSAAA